MSDSPFQAEIEGWNIVLRGNFNPSIFQPMWFVRHGLLPEGEATAAAIQIIRPEITHFTAGLMTFLVSLDKFQISVSSAEAAETIRDIVIGTFHILAETPIAQLGINRELHFKMSSADRWHKVGHALAPKELWSGLMEELGTRSVAMQGKRTGASSLHVRVTVEPSGKIIPGVYISSNEHFEKKSEQSTEWIIPILTHEWAPAHANAKRVAEELLARCLQ